MALNAGRATIGLLLLGRADVNSIVRGIYMLNGAFATNEKMLRKMGLSTKNATRGALALAKAQQIARVAVQRLWGAIKIGTVAIVVAAVALTKKLADIESEVQRVYAMTRGGEKERLSYMNASMTAAVKYKGHAEDMAKALWWVVSAGYKGAKAIKVMDAAMALSTATSADAERTSEVLMGQLFAMGKGAEYAAHYADILTNTVNLSLLSMDDLGTALQYVTPAAKNLGWTFEELTAAIAVLRDAGISASRVGTGLRGIMVQLLNPSDKVAAILEKHGIVLDELRDAMKDPIKFVTMLKNANFDTAESFKIFGRWAGSAGIALVHKLPALKKYIKLNNEVKDGLAGIVAAERQNTLYGQLERVYDMVVKIAEYGFRAKNVLGGIKDALRGLADRLISAWESSGALFGKNLKLRLEFVAENVGDYLNRIFREHQDDITKAAELLGSFVGHSVFSVISGIFKTFFAVVTGGAYNDPARNAGEVLGGALAKGIGQGIANAMADNPVLSVVLGGLVGAVYGGGPGALAGAATGFGVSMTTRQNRGWRAQFEAERTFANQGESQRAYEQWVKKYGDPWQQLQLGHGVGGGLPGMKAVPTWSSGGGGMLNTSLLQWLNMIVLGQPNVGKGGGANKAKMAIKPTLDAITQEYRAWAGRLNTSSRKWGESFAIWYGRGIKSRINDMLAPVREAVSKIKAILDELNSILGGAVAAERPTRSAARAAVSPGQRWSTTGAEDDIANRVAARFGFGGNITPEKTLAAARAVKKAIGTPYVIGGSSLSGMDCSGFVSYVLNQSGIMNGRWTSGTFPGVLSPGVGPLTVWGKPPTTGPYGHAWLSFWNKYFFESSRPSVHKMVGNRGDSTYHGIPSLWTKGIVKSGGIAKVERGEKITGSYGGGDINFYIDGANDPEAVAVVVDRRLRQVFRNLSPQKVGFSRVPSG